MKMEFPEGRKLLVCLKRAEESDGRLGRRVNRRGKQECYAENTETSNPPFSAFLPPCTLRLAFP